MSIKDNTDESEQKALKVISILGKEKSLDVLKEMLLIRQFEIQGENAYKQGFIGGFYHSSIGQEAISSAFVAACGKNHWFFSTYRCHALAILLEGSIQKFSDELYGKVTGCAKGRGGSMHMCTDKMPGGFGIVGGHIPLAAGAAFSLKYLNNKDSLSVCFLGDGAVAQGVFHETLNLASLFSLPLMLIVENNSWGMGTSVKKALSFYPLAEKQAPSYDIEGYTFNGMDFFDCFLGFHNLSQNVLKNSFPVIIECVCERFRGHSISDPGLYRTKDELQKCMKLDPIEHIRSTFIKLNILNECSYQEMKNKAKETVKEAFKKSESSPLPLACFLEEDVYAP